MRIDTQRLAQSVTETGERPAALARRAQISASHLANAMAGRRGLSAEALDRLAKVMRINPEALYQTGNPPGDESETAIPNASIWPVVLDGKAVCYWRRHFEMTVGELAESAGVSRSWVLSVERSRKTRLPATSDRGRRLAGALAVPLAALDATPARRPPGWQGARVAHPVPIRDHGT
jgi:transcriptional regulator with XRE-family HTH domain